MLPMRHLLTLWLLLAPVVVSAAELTEAMVISQIDGTPQPVRFWAPAKADAPMPLLVLLHSWSGDYRQTGAVEVCLTECEQRGWALIAPNFRGPNIRPEACGSEQAIRDVVDAVDWMIDRHRIDAERIYLVGTSGGGHMALLLAGRAPDRWAGISAWVGISDLAAWHAQCKAADRKYYKDLELVCGGPPGTSPGVDEQYGRRSPLTHLSHAKGIPIDISAGIHDGHTGSVPVGQSLTAFNKLADANDRPQEKIPVEAIVRIEMDRRIPDTIDNGIAAGDPLDAGRQHPVLLRRQAGPARLTIFEGGHEGDMPAAIRWLAAQRWKRD